MKTKTRYLIRFLLLTAGFALITMGILGWQEVGFELSTLWPVASELKLHPIHLVVVGMALIPPTLWEIFILEQNVDRSGKS